MFPTGMKVICHLSGPSELPEVASALCADRGFLRECPCRNNWREMGTVPNHPSLPRGTVGPNTDLVRIECDSRQPDSQRNSLRDDMPFTWFGCEYKIFNMGVRGVTKERKQDRLSSEGVYFWSSRYEQGLLISALCKGLECIWYIGALSRR